MTRNSEDTAPSASALSRWENEGGAPAPNPQAAPSRKPPKPVREPKPDGERLRH